MRSYLDQDSLLIRPNWARTAVDRLQVLAGDPRTDPNQILEALKDLAVQLPRVHTHLEAALLRGLLAEFLLYHLARIGVAPSAAALALMRSESLSPTDEAIWPDRASAHPKIAVALSLIAALCHRPDVRLKDIATMVNLSPWHLSRLLHRHDGLARGARFNPTAFQAVSFQPPTRVTGGWGGGLST